MSGEMHTREFSAVAADSSSEREEIHGYEGNVPRRVQPLDVPSWTGTAVHSASTDKQCRQPKCAGASLSINNLSMSIEGNRRDFPASARILRSRTMTRPRASDWRPIEFAIGCHRPRTSKRLLYIPNQLFRFLKNEIRYPPPSAGAL